MTAKMTDTPSRPAWRHPERDSAEWRLKAIKEEADALVDRREKHAIRLAEIFDRMTELSKQHSRDSANYAEAATLQREQQDLQIEDMKIGGCLSTLGAERNGALQRLRDIDELDAGRCGIAR